MTTLLAKAFLMAGMILGSSAWVFAKLPESSRPYSSKKAKLVIIASTQGEPYRSSLRHFHQQLAARGWVQGKNLEVTEYFIGNHEHTIANIWHHVIRKEGADAIFISGTTAGIGAKLYLANKNLKVIFSDVTDPIGVGLIEKFDIPPKAEFTGVCFSVDVEERIRFIRKLLPHTKRLGFVYADMPSSRSYLKWLQEALSKPEFKDLSLVAEKIPFVPGEGGYIRMTEYAEGVIRRLDSQVDVFLSPSDSLGAQPLYVQTMDRLATKPLIGLQEREVLEKWGAAAAMYVPIPETGNIAANMVGDVLNGKNIKDILPRCPKAKIIVDEKRIEKQKRGLAESHPAGPRRHRAYVHTDQ